MALPKHEQAPASLKPGRVIVFSLLLFFIMNFNKINQKK
jgi:hypothetical protein